MGKTQTLRSTVAIAALALACPAFAATQCNGSEIVWQWTDHALEPVAAAFLPDGRHLVAGAKMAQAGRPNANTPRPHGALVMAVEWNTGDIIWRTSIEEDDAREITAIATTSQGHTLVAGQVGITPTAIGGYEEEFGWVARLDADGQLLWERRFGDSGSLHGLNSIVPLSDGSLIVAGWTDVSSHESDDGYGWLMRLADDGEVTWEIKTSATIAGALPKHGESVTIVTVSPETGNIEALEADGGGKLFPLWGHIVDAENIWLPAPLEGYGEEIIIRSVAHSDTASGDRVSILNFAKTGTTAWEASLELDWPWAIAPAGPARELIVIPLDAADSLSLLMLDALSGDRIAWRDSGLGRVIANGVLGALDSFNIALFGIDPEREAGILARIGLACN